MSVRSIMCSCGTSRPDNEARSPACGRREGREVVERKLVPDPDMSPPTSSPMVDALGCGLCGLARMRPAHGALLVCPFCDAVRDID